MLLRKLLIMIAALAQLWRGSCAGMSHIHSMHLLHWWWAARVPWTRSCMMLLLLVHKKVLLLHTACLLLVLMEAAMIPRHVAELFDLPRLLWITAVVGFLLHW